MNSVKSEALLISLSTYSRCLENDWCSVISSKYISETKTLLNPFILGVRVCICSSKLHWRNLCRFGGVNREPLVSPTPPYFWMKPWQMLSVHSKDVINIDFCLNIFCASLPRHTLFYCTLLYLLHLADTPFFPKGRFLTSLGWTSLSAHFPTAFAHFMLLCPILAFLIRLRPFHYDDICYGDLWSAIIDGAIEIAPKSMSRTPNRVKCVCVVRCSPNGHSIFSLPLLGPPHSPRHSGVEIRSMNNPPVAPQCSRERRRITQLVFHFKSKARNGNGWWRRLVESQGDRRRRPIPPVSHIADAKASFWKEIESATPVSTLMTRKWNGLIADRGEVLVVWVDHTSHNIPWHQSLIPSKAFTLLMKCERGEEAVEENFKSNRGVFARFRRRSHLCNVKV